MKMRGAVKAREGHGVLPVEGMTCASCVAIIENVVRHLPAVTHVSVSLMTEEAEVAYVPHAGTSPDTIREAMADLGFTVTGLDKAVQGKATQEGYFGPRSAPIWRNAPPFTGFRSGHASSSVPPNWGVELEEARSSILRAPSMLMGAFINCVAVVGPCTLISPSFLAFAASARVASRLLRSPRKCPGVPGLEELTGCEFQVFTRCELRAKRYA